MFTIFSIPKPFIGHIGIIQRNAIQSWKKIHPECEVILFGDEQGVREAAEEFDLINVPEIRKNEYGTPTLDFVFQKANVIAKQNILCYANSDIILNHDILTAIAEIPFKKYLIIGQRYDLDITSAIDYSDNYWEQQLNSLFEKQWDGKFCGGMDYFIFPRHSLENIPPFAVGRGGWDNWVIYHVRKNKTPVIDATGYIRAIHQNHGYTHVPKRAGPLWEGPETEQNHRLVGNIRHFWQLTDANWVLDKKGLRKKPLNLWCMYQYLILKLPESLYPILDLAVFVKSKMKATRSRKDK
jgi:hypothetical protein